MNDISLIWDQFNDRLRNFIRARVSNESDAEDILQDLFLKIHSQHDSFNKVSKPESWIFKVVRNAIIDYYRARRPQSELDDSHQLQEPDRAEYDFDEIVRCLEPLVNNLSDKDQQIIKMVDFQHMTQQDAAEQLGITLSGVKSRVQRARKRLRKKFLDCCSLVHDENGKIIDYHQHDNSCICPTGHNTD